MICCDSQAYYVYDEEDTECSEELRRVTGGHRDEISIITYNDHFSLVATGSLDGDVILWDFEMSKIEAILQGHTSDITGIQFMVPYPLLLTSSMDCTVCLWAIRPAPFSLRYVCLNRFINQSWLYTMDRDTPVSQILFYSDNMKGLKRHQRLKDGLFGPNSSKYGQLYSSKGFKKS
jgi:WD40 repeat protein